MALKEFGDLSSRTIADMCGVGNKFVSEVRKVCLEHTSNEQQTTVNGSDGKVYPAHKPPRATEQTTKQDAVEREEAEYLQKALAFPAARVYTFPVPELGTGIQPPTNTEEDNCPRLFRAWYFGTRLNTESAGVFVRSQDHG